VCAFWGFFDIAPYFKGEIPTNRNFWRVNKRFQAKRGKIWKVSYYRNYWIDSYQILHSDRDHKVVIAANKPKMTNGRHFEKKPLNRISATKTYVNEILTGWRKLVPYSGRTV